MALSGGKLAWIRRGSKRQVNRATIDPLPWMIWGVLGIITLVPQIAQAGWEWALLFGFGNVAINVLVVWTARKHDLHWPTYGDWIMIGIAVAGMVLWAWQRDASYGLFFCLIADAVGVLRIWSKIVRDPERELVGTWFLGALAAVSGYASATYAKDDLVGWYPLYVIINATASMLIVIGCRMYRRRRAATASVSTRKTA